MRIPESEWKWQGHPGHFFLAEDCQFRLCTVVGNKLISTVGDLMEKRANGTYERRTLGARKTDFFETYVFHVNPEADYYCGCQRMRSACEIDGRRWSTAQEATAGHMEYCRKYAEDQGPDYKESEDNDEN